MDGTLPTAEDRRSSPPVTTSADSSDAPSAAASAAAASLPAACLPVASEAAALTTTTLRETPMTPEELERELAGQHPADAAARADALRRAAVWQQAALAEAGSARGINPYVYQPRRGLRLGEAYQADIPAFEGPAGATSMDGDGRALGASDDVMDTRADVPTPSAAATGDTAALVQDGGAPEGGVTRSAPTTVGQGEGAGGAQGTEASSATELGAAITGTAGSEPALSAADAALTAKAERLTEHLRAIVAALHSEPNAVQVCLTTVARVLARILAEPDNMRARRVNTQSVTFAKTTSTAHAEVCRLLQEVGFGFEADGMHLLYGRNDLGLLWLAKDMVASTSTVALGAALSA